MSQCMKCERCQDYYHGEPGQSHSCKLFEFKYRERIIKFYTDSKEPFIGEWSEIKIWSTDKRKALREVMSERFFRDGNSTSGYKLEVEIIANNALYIGEARMRYDSSVKRK